MSRARDFFMGPDNMAPQNETAFTEFTKKHRVSHNTSQHPPFWSHNGVTRLTSTGLTVGVCVEPFCPT
jgi:hypothetical protein